MDPPPHATQTAAHDVEVGVADGERGTGRQAVVLVHGIGQQRPMDTLRGFGAAIVGEGRETYAVPDVTDASFELHTLVVPGVDGGPRTDLYEGYWAPESHGTTLAHVWTWSRRLLLRAPSQLPARIRGLAVRVAIGLAVVVAALLWVVPDLVDLLTGEDVAWVAALAKLVLAAVAAGITGWLTDSLGDAARYLDVRPANIALRQSIRRRLVGMLDALHESGRYDRIVVVGHSLGGVIAYDALRLLWRERVCGVGVTIDPSVDDGGVAGAARKLLRAVDAGVDTPGVVDRFRAAQERCQAQLAAAHPGLWLVTDLVTLGSPVAHATWLLADGGADLHTRIRERELPTCPPQPGTPEGDTYRYPDATGERLHHGAVFAVTRWTNAWFPGDPVGGPVRPTGPMGAGTLDRDAGLGAGVRDVALTGPSGVLRGLASHSRYWVDERSRDAIMRALGLEPPPRS
jgi:hypothetical protein